MLVVNFFTVDHINKGCNTCGRKLYCEKPFRNGD